MVVEVKSSEVEEIEFLDWETPPAL